MSKVFYLARRSDGHRFEGTKIWADDVKDAEAKYQRLKFNLSADLVVVGARR